MEGFECESLCGFCLPARGCDNYSVILCSSLEMSVLTLARRQQLAPLHHFHFSSIGLLYRLTYSKKHWYKLHTDSNFTEIIQSVQLRKLKVASKVLLLAVLNSFESQLCHCLGGATALLPCPYKFEWQHIVYVYLLFSHLYLLQPREYNCMYSLFSI